MYDEEGGKSKWDHFFFLYCLKNLRKVKKKKKKKKKGKRWQRKNV